mmetsp:Transcript_25002/g.41425  ORF Transcript_25002/g.41425 Transcript_25002/m.41425 type:complete len:217 (-) Transcript_25002:143-793(-)
MNVKARAADWAAASAVAPAIASTASHSATAGSLSGVLAVSCCCPDTHGNGSRGRDARLSYRLARTSRSTVIPTALMSDVSLCVSIERLDAACRRMTSQIVHKKMAPIISRGAPKRRRRRSEPPVTEVLTAENTVRAAPAVTLRAAAVVLVTALRLGKRDCCTRPAQLCVMPAQLCVMPAQLCAMPPVNAGAAATAEQTVVRAEVCADQWPLAGRPF